MATLATLQTRLTAAEDALHSLYMGERVVTVSNDDGGSVTYNQASTAKLEGYISKLKAEISALNGSSRRGPLIMSF